MPAVSTATQSTDAQVAELKASGCDRIFHEKVSSRVPRREEGPTPGMSGNAGGGGLPLHKQVGPLWEKRWSRS
jgi:hypothetical protein